MNIYLKSGDALVVEENATCMQAAMAISEGLARNAICAKVNGELVREVYNFTTDAKVYDRSLGLVYLNEGTNTVTVKNGKVAVTEADCPDHYCMKRGYCDSGAQIVCLPNRLVLTFTGASEVDGVAG